MTIPTYAVLPWTRLPGEYPRLAEQGSIERDFAMTYVGSPALERRIRSSLRRFAVRRFSFWRPSATAVILYTLAFIALGGREPIWVPITAAIVFLIIATAMPFATLRGVDIAATEYARPGEVYGALVEADSLLWKLPDVVFEISFSEVQRVVSYGGVSVLGLKHSRAIVVLPEELLSASQVARIGEVASTASD
ncbi:MAG: hypothetical protein QOF79_1796 [Actinomycetota bacterium]|nr:hypothetical protein [Actinomycetota bacterium]